MIPISRNASPSQRRRPKIACWRQGPGSPATSARVHPVLRRSSPSKPSKKALAETAPRSWVNNGRIRAFTSGNVDAQSSSVASIDKPGVHDLRITETHCFRNQVELQL